MAEILGLGLTHYPGLFMHDKDASVFLRNTLARGGLPAHLKDPANWPEPMRREWSNDNGAKAAFAHRERGFAANRKLRQALDDFAPDLVLIWGDDQYENFIEDIVPPFCCYILDRIESRPYAFWDANNKEFANNIWEEAEDTLFVHRGHSEAARYLVNQLSVRGLEVPYAYRLRYKRGLAHAFINTLLYHGQFAGDEVTVGFTYSGFNSGIVVEPPPPDLIVKQTPAIACPSPMPPVSGVLPNGTDFCEVMKPSPEVATPSSQ